MTPRTGRAAPLAPDARRQAVIDAVMPLLVVHGPTLTTRRMAEAAGVAEGTIFRVFPDKTALIEGVARAAVDPAEVCRQLDGIDRAAPIETTVRAAAEILYARMERIVALLGALRATHGHRAHASWQPPPFVAEANEAVTEGLTELFGPHRSRLRLDPQRAAVVLRSLVAAAAMPAHPRPDLDEVVDVALNGLVVSGADG